MDNSTSREHSSKVLLGKKGILHGGPVFWYLFQAQITYKPFNDYHKGFLAYL